MGAAKKLAAKRVDEKLLTRYLPFQSLELEDLKNLAPKCQLLSYPSNRILFRRGDNDPRTYFLVTGEIEISSRRIGILRLKAGTEAARDAIADVIPRRVEMRTTQPTTFLVIDRHLLEVTTNSELAANYHVSEMESSDDWMSMFLGSLNTNKIPPQNIQALLLRMKEIPVQPGHVIVRQGDKDSHYYIIKEGRCAVTRYTPEHGDTTLAELGAGTGFGEEALITKSTRNATVTMLEPGTVMRLSKEDFLQLLVRPVVDLVTYPEAEELVAQGGKLIDIRMHIDRQDYLEGAALIPMPELRARLPQLPKSQPCIVFCNNGQVSAAAAFLLAQHGFDAYVLMGGIERVSPGARLLQRVRLGAVPEAASPFEEQSRSRADKQERKFRQTQELKTDDQLADIATDDATGDHRPWLQKLQQEVHNLRQELERDRRDISSLREGLVPRRHDAPGTRSTTPHAAAEGLEQELQEVRSQLFEAQAQIVALQTKCTEMTSDIIRLKKAQEATPAAPADRQAKQNPKGADIVHMATRDTSRQEDDAYVEAIRSWTSELESQLIKADSLQDSAQTKPITHAGSRKTAIEAQPDYVQRRATKKRP